MPMTKLFNHMMAIFTYQHLFTNKWCQPPPDKPMLYFVFSKPACATFQSDKSGADFQNDGFHSGITKGSSVT
jgi:hypothetical protein